jgi:hypothetical protein
MVSFSPGQEAARRLLEGPQRYTCLAGGTRSGKTFLIVRAIVKRALRGKGSRHAILRFHANAARASISTWYSSASDAALLSKSADKGAPSGWIFLIAK